MSSIITSTRLLASFASIALAGSSSDPAFFLRSEWNYLGLYHTEQATIASRNGQTYWGWNSATSEGWIGIAGENLDLNGDSWNWKTSTAPRAFYSLQFHGIGVFGNAKDSSDWKIGAQARGCWKTMEALFASSLSQDPETHWNIRHSAFPDSKPYLAGTWNQQQRALYFSLSQTQTHWGVSGKVRGVRSSPNSQVASYFVEDSSLWVSGALSGYLDAGPLALSADASSTSGRSTLRGIRQDNHVTRLVSKSISGWDQNGVQLVLAPAGFRHPVVVDPQWAHLNAPLAALPIPHLEPTPGAWTCKFGFQRFDGHIEEPAKGSREESLWGNRLFAPDLTNMLGFSFYRKNISYWGKGSVDIAHSEMTFPFPQKAWTPWVSGGFEYWYGTATSFWRERTVMLIAEQSKLVKDHWQLEGSVVLAGIGTRYHASWRLPVTILLGLQQAIPLRLQMKKNGESLIQRNHSSNTDGFDPFQDGFGGNLALQWHLK